MTKRVLTFGAALGVFAVALLAILQILDLVSFQEATESMAKILSVIVVSSAAIVLMITLLRRGTRH
jgi:uncharacterized membrane protein